MSQLLSNPEYVRLLQQWNIEKANEKRANEKRLEAERGLLNFVKLYNDNGVNNFDGDLKITTGYTQTIDNILITSFYVQWLQGTFINSLPAFPFAQEWKPDNTYLKSIKQNQPELYKNWIQPAITTKPKKPSFSIKE